MFNISAAQLEAWIGQYFWPFVRIGSCLMVAPMFSANMVPARMRIIIAAAITLLVAPLIRLPQATPLLSASGFWITAQQLVIGVALGFALQIVFDAISMGGQFLASSMGLSFALNVDPVNGTSTPVLGQFYSIIVMLTFLALNGHLILIEVLVQGFTTLPIGEQGLGGDGIWMLVNWGGQLFAGALMVALPGMTALLIVNLGFGVMSRAAPTLNLFAVGFPAALILGLIIAMMSLPVVQNSFVTLLTALWEFLMSMQGGGA